MLFILILAVGSAAAQDCPLQFSNSKVSICLTVDKGPAGVQLDGSVLVRIQPNHTESFMIQEMYLVDGNRRHEQMVTDDKNITLDFEQILFSKTYSPKEVEQKLHYLIHFEELEKKYTLSKNEHFILVESFDTLEIKVNAIQPGYHERFPFSSPKVFHIGKIDDEKHITILEGYTPIKNLSQDI